MKDLDTPIMTRIGSSTTILRTSVIDNATFSTTTSPLRERRSNTSTGRVVRFSSSDAVTHYRRISSKIITEYEDNKNDQDQEEKINATEQAMAAITKALATSTATSNTDSTEPPPPCPKANLLVYWDEKLTPLSSTRRRVYVGCPTSSEKKKKRPFTSPGSRFKSHQTAYAPPPRRSISLPIMTDNESECDHSSSSHNAREEENCCAVTTCNSNPSDTKNVEPSSNFNREQPPKETNSMPSAVLSTITTHSSNGAMGPTSSLSNSNNTTGASVDVDDLQLGECGGISLASEASGWITATVANVLFCPQHIPLDEEEEEASATTLNAGTTAKHNQMSQHQTPPIELSRCDSLITRAKAEIKRRQKLEQEERERRQQRLALLSAASSTIFSSNGGNSRRSASANDISTPPVARGRSNISSNYHARTARRSKSTIIGMAAAA